jgi:hypothetical protein
LSNKGFKRAGIMGSEAETTITDITAKPQARKGVEK